MSRHEFQTRAEAKEWARQLVPLLQRPCVVLLAGDLGSGKTQVVKWCLETLGVTVSMSPTFAIHQRYAGSTGDIDHVDLYRLKSDADLESSGFWDLLQDPHGLLFVEWADRLPRDVWPRAWRQVYISLSKRAEAEEARIVELEIRPPA